MTDIDFTYLAEKVFDTHSYPSHLLRDRYERDLDTGKWCRVMNRAATLAAIEVSMRMYAEKGIDPLDGLYSSTPALLGTGVAKKPETITNEQACEIEAALVANEMDTAQFLEYMKADSIESIPAKDYKKAMTALNAKGKPKIKKGAGDK